MSKLPKNFEKALLGAAGVCAIGFIALGFMKSNAVGTDFNYEVARDGKKDPTIPEAPAAKTAGASLMNNLTVKQAVDTTRGVNLFTGVNLFATKNDPTHPIEPRRGAMVHPPIDNDWWERTGADMTHADSPARDDDNDGFSNLEEFEAHTNPMDQKDVPPVIKKLAYIKDESVKWYVTFGLASDGQWAPKLLGQSAAGAKFDNRVSAAEMIKPGDLFFKDKTFKERFRFLEIVAKKVTSERTKSEETVNVGIYEDLKANKKGTKYESQERLPENEIDSHAYFDRTAVLDLQAVGEKGKEFKVEEGTAFALPSTATEKKYFLKKVTPEGVEVEYTDEKGKQSWSIPKGGPAKRTDAAGTPTE
ncbi:Amuc_1099 family pilus-like system protein [Haloferula sp. BvORR071]|uniref:Amuc_1099 family pilus-like system protein n=1 Tax=Haloferula sp. BvORR071 TaxID=1396141 RepID=UPI000551172D|nr:Amuc_1099 family pilus-like system protein [Haloferula sp. BvORR071]